MDLDRPPRAFEPIVRKRGYRDYVRGSNAVGPKESVVLAPGFVIREERTYVVSQISEVAIHALVEQSTSSEHLPTPRLRFLRLHHSRLIPVMNRRTRQSSSLNGNQFRTAKL